MLYLISKIKFIKKCFFFYFIVNTNLLLPIAAYNCCHLYSLILGWRKLLSLLSTGDSDLCCIIKKEETNLDIWLFLLTKKNILFRFILFFFWHKFFTLVEKAAFHLFYCTLFFDSKKLWEINLKYWKKKNLNKREVYLFSFMILIKKIDNKKNKKIVDW